jgi:hypothetical protein
MNKINEIEDKYLNDNFTCEIPRCTNLASYVGICVNCHNGSNIKKIKKYFESIKNDGEETINKLNYLIICTNEKIKHHRSIFKKYISKTVDTSSLINIESHKYITDNINNKIIDVIYNKNMKICEKVKYCIDNKYYEMFNKKINIINNLKIKNDISEQNEHVCISYLLIYKYTTLLKYLENVKKRFDNQTLLTYNFDYYGTLKLMTQLYNSRLWGGIIQFIPEDKIKLFFKNEKNNLRIDLFIIINIDDKYIPVYIENDDDGHSNSYRFQRDILKDLFIWSNNISLIRLKYNENIVDILYKFIKYNRYPLCRFYNNYFDTLNNGDILNEFTINETIIRVRKYDYTDKKIKYINNIVDKKILSKIVCFIDDITYDSSDDCYTSIEYKSFVNMTKYRFDKKTNYTPLHDKMSKYIDDCDK